MVPSSFFLFYTFIHICVPNNIVFTTTKKVIATTEQRNHINFYRFIAFEYRIPSAHSTDTVKILLKFCDGS